MCADSTGIDYQTWEDSNVLLYIECLRYDSSLSEEDYRGCAWPETELRLEGGQVAQSRLEEPRIRQPYANGSKSKTTSLGIVLCWWVR